MLALLVESPIIAVMVETNAVHDYMYLALNADEYLTSPVFDVTPLKFNAGSAFDKRPGRVLDTFSIIYLKLLSRSVTYVQNSFN